MTPPNPNPSPPSDEIRFKVFAWKTEPTIKTQERLVSGWVTTEEVDMDGEVMIAKGAQTDRYIDRIRSVNFNHKSDMPVGRCDDFAIHPGKGIWVRTYVTKTPFGDDIMTMLTEGVVSAHSIEFKYIQGGYGAPTTAEKSIFGDQCGSVQRKWEWLAYCFTHMPCNPGALVQGVKSLRAEAEAERTRAKVADLYRGRKIGTFGLAALELTPRDVERRSWSMANLGDDLTVIFHRKSAA